MKQNSRTAITSLMAIGLVTFLSAAPEIHAARLENPVAQFAGIDKITGRITTFDVYVNETVQFGALQVTPKVCYSRDESETQRMDAFVEVDEITLDRKIRRIFSGWMFADSPALNAVEHAIYDVWLTGCTVTSDVPAPPGVEAVAKPAPEPEKPADAPTAAAATTTPPSEPVAVTPSDPAEAALPPLDAPQEIPSEIIGGAPQVDGFEQQGEPVLQGDPAVPPPPVPPGSVGLF
ncbi:DUF2155 domain-containing protein [Peteryoungia desertarenae]|uniref:DUF2155 domain-containing protein n=1 Tax=Peteryoungia desertarenae TaxID=1813451 RepID=A0ABX6QPC6_9HYPH|nr:DUF2155 domain-containing protein [Peteryoungia desertarenae]